jgi:hypothetical protein
MSGLGFSLRALKQVTLLDVFSLVAGWNYWVTFLPGWLGESCGRGLSLPLQSLPHVLFPHALVSGLHTNRTK